MNRRLSRYGYPGFSHLRQGSESILHKGTYLGKACLVKERFEKKYRNPELDSALTHDRIKSECRAIAKCLSHGIRTPLIYAVNLNKRIIVMQFYEYNITAKDYLTQCSDEDKQNFATVLGGIIGKMHSINVIHGDLTTSNILLVNDKQDDYSNFQDLNVIMIDFGLAHTESNIEDKGIDLYVLERALSATLEDSDNLLDKIFASYEAEFSDSKQVFQKYSEIQSRGRKKMS